MNKSVFIKNNKFFIIERDMYESTEKFNERGYFISNMLPETKSDYDEAVRLSRIWVNMKFNNCKYDQKLCDKINKIVENF